METLREIRDRDHGLPSDTSVSQKTVLCDKCHNPFYVIFPSEVSTGEVNAFLNRLYPERQRPCYHPVHEVVEIFKGDLRPRRFDRLDPALYQRTSPKGRLPNQPR